MTRTGTWAVCLVAVALVLVVALLTVVPGDSVVTWVFLLAALACIVDGGVMRFLAIVRHGERAVSVYAAGSC